MTLLIVSFIAGVLTILAPCVLPLLPVVVGGSLARSGDNGNSPWRRPLIVTASLAISVIIFTLLLKATTILLGVPTAVWQVIAGVIVIFFGVTMLAPRLWEEIMIRTRLQARSSQLMGKTTTKKGVSGDVLLGLSLGPVFSSCSPTYALIVAAVLPVSFGEGFVYLMAYAVGLSAMLLLVTLLGKSLVDKLGWTLNPRGWFHKIIGIIFLIVGAGLIFGLDKKVQEFVLDQGWYDPIMHVEESFRR
jgi:cytochrome c biogenesis protein CcdA